MNSHVKYDMLMFFIEDTDELFDGALGALEASLQMPVVRVGHMMRVRGILSQASADDSMTKRVKVLELGNDMTANREV